MTEPHLTCLISSHAQQGSSFLQTQAFGVPSGICGGRALCPGRLSTKPAAAFLGAGVAGRRRVARQGAVFAPSRPAAEGF